MISFNKLDKQCEHRCIVGSTKDYFIFDGECISVNVKNICLYNFCPGCGQELELTTTDYNTDNHKYYRIAKK